MGKNILVEDNLEEQVVVSTNSHTNFLELPSKGKCGYNATIEYRDMLVCDEERLASSSADLYATTLNSIIKSILLENKDFEKFTVADRDYALVWIWANNYSPTKKVGITCANKSCRHEFETSVDLTKLEVTHPKDNFISSMKLPISKINGHVHVRLNTVKDEIVVEEYMKNNPDSSYDYLMLIASIEIGVPLMFNKKVEWVRNNVSSAELGRVKQYHKYFSFGLPQTINHTCPKCKEVTVSLVPFQATDILRPTLADDFEQFLQSNQDS